MSSRNSESRLYFTVSPTGGSLPDHNSPAARGLRIVTDDETFSIGTSFVDMLMCWLPVRTVDLVGENG